MCPEMNKSSRAIFPMVCSFQLNPSLFHCPSLIHISRLTINNEIELGFIAFDIIVYRLKK